MSLVVCSNTKPKLKKIGITYVYGKNDGVRYTVVVTPNKLFNVFILEMELDILFDVMDTPMEIDAPIGLRIRYAITNNYGNQISC
jgi:hypothetical protein